MKMPLPINFSTPLTGSKMLVLKSERMKVWPPNRPDLYPIKNLWEIKIKRRVYINGRQFTSLKNFWSVNKDVSALLTSFKI